MTRIEISLGGTRPAPAKKARAAEPKQAAPAPVEVASAAAAAAPAEEPEAHEHVKGMPKGYEEMTVAQIAEGAKSWNRPMLEAALEYEQANAARKGAIAALTSALKAKGED